MSSASSHLVSPALDGASLAAAVRALFNLSWGKARTWIEGSKISINGVICLDKGRRVLVGEVLSLSLNSPKPRAEMELCGDVFVYLDDQVLVVNKPAGISTVPFEEGERGTLLDLARRYLYRRERKVGGAQSGIPFLGIVHRLDRETTGLLVFARTWMAKERLAKQFRDHLVHRRYRALANGEVRTQTIQSAILADRGDGLRGSLDHRCTPGPVTPLLKKAKHAVTHVEALERLAGSTFIACRLETGRTHQIRIHLSETGYPLVGERVYTRGFTGKLIPASRIMLHAGELGFRHPGTGRDMRWEQPLPSDMLELLERLRRA